MTRRLSALVAFSAAVHTGLVLAVLAVAGVVGPPPMLLVDLVGGGEARDEPVAAERGGPEGGARRPGRARVGAAPSPAGPEPAAFPAPGLELRPQAVVSAPLPPTPIPPVTPPREPARPPVQTSQAPAAPPPPEPTAVAEPVLPARSAPPIEPGPAVSRPGPPAPDPPAASVPPAPRATRPGAPSALAGSARSAGPASAPGAADAAAAGGGGAVRSSAGGPPDPGRGQDGGETAASGAGSGHGLALAVPGAGAEVAEYGAYYALVRRRIHERLAYPSSARHRALSGTVEIEVEIAANGALGRVSLVASSSHGMLDEAALDAARGLRRVPFPPDVRPQPLRVRLPIVFRLR